MKLFRLVPLLAVPLMCGVAYAQELLDDFDLSKWKAGGVTLAQAPQERTRLTFEPWDWPNVRFVAPAPHDWTGRGLELETFNPSAQPLEFYVRIDDDEKSDGWHGCRTAKMTALPGQAQKWLISLGGVDPMSQGMRALPPVRPQNGATVATSEGAAPLNIQHIMAWQLFLSHPREKTSLDVGAFKLAPSPDTSLVGIVDAFGQYTGADWPGKIGSQEALKSAQTAEERELTARPTLSKRDRFGGDANGPLFTATGFFRTQKDGGKWWLVTPEGHAFWSAGVDTMQSAEPTITTGREAMFVSLPTNGEPLAAFRGADNNVLMGPQKGNKAASFDFYRANLWRKYGDDWKNRWTLTALQRLRSWGFNTIGNWSEDGLHDARWGDARVPYTVPIHLWGTHATVPSEGAYWAPMHDPFDTQFARDVAARVAETTPKAVGDPYCIGYFVDNELSWGGFDDKNWKTRYGLAIGALALGGDSPAKAAFVADLKAKYPSIEALNLAWKTQFASWDAVRAPFKVTDTPNDAQQRDFSAYLTHFADQYFQTVRDALKKADPNHLYLGCRLAWRNPEAVASAAKWCDVVSFNIYAPRVEDRDWGFTSGIYKPILIGEFHMGALDRGMFHPGLVKAKDQNERAQMFADYLQSVAKRPNFVGAHWFQYTDEALTGRPLDGENYNIGFVSATDTPYPEMVAAAREANAHIYEWHAGK
ncbi:hypothetical protein IAD21_02681 [Abditibacteriota bacterium]|nr:hypothetical protein IAD21_02681 [Abditibacteriota bacterium]